MIAISSPKPLSTCTGAVLSELVADIERLESNNWAGGSRFRAK